MSWVRYEGCPNCGCGGATPCCPLPPSTVLRAVFTNRDNCACLDGYTINNMVYVPAFDWWSPAAVAPPLCGESFTSSLIYYQCNVSPLRCPEFVTVGNHQFGFRVGQPTQWNFHTGKRTTLPELPFNGCDNTVDFFCFEGVEVTVICSPFFFQARGVRMCGVAPPTPCDGTFDVTITEQP